MKSSDRERSGFFRRHDERTVASSIAHPPPTRGSDRLYLLAASAYGPFRPVYDTLAAMAVYKLDPGDIRELQTPDPGDLLDRSGGNTASVLDRIQSRSTSGVSRVSEYLSAIVPGAVGVESKSIGPKMTLEFLQQVRGRAESSALPGQQCVGWNVARTGAARRAVSAHRHCFRVHGIDRHRRTGDVPAPRGRRRADRRIARSERNTRR